jgi:hypothetical protein
MIMVFREKTVKNIQPASFSSSPVESSAKGTARSVSEYDGVSDGVGSRKTLLFRPFEGTRRAFDASRLFSGLMASTFFYFWDAATNVL